MKTFIHTLGLVAITLMLMAPSCAKTTYLKTNDLEKSKVASPQTQADIDRNKIIEYVKAKKLRGNFTSSGIFYVIDEPGTGLERPTAESLITAHYAGTTLADKKFDSSFDKEEPLKFKLGQVIKGWQESIQMLGKGGKGKFIIPSSLAYGERTIGEVITENSVLVFTIELLDFKTE